MKLFETAVEAENYLLAEYRPLTHVSASCIESYLSCPRQFFDKYCLREREPGSEATDLGGIIHSLLEAFIRDGIDIDSSTPEGKITTGALPYLPAPKSEGIFCEVSLDDLPLKDACSLSFKGFIDLLDIRNPAAILITDYKTSSNIKKYSKTSEQLAENIQLLIYAKHVVDNYPCEKIILRHIYLQTKGDIYTLVVETVLAREEVNFIFDSTIRPLVDEIKLASTKRASQQKKNLQHCHAWGATCSNLPACLNPNREVSQSSYLKALCEDLKETNNENY